jgi:multiple sugar transport system permease protein
MTRTRIWQEFLRGKNQNQFGNLSVELKGSATKFEELKINPSAPEYPEFVKTKVPVRYQEKSFEDVWVAKFAAMRPPTKAFDAAFVTANKDAIRGEFASRNYRYIIDYIALNGRALWNTFFLCGLTILAQLIVNPIAAYAISRYPIKSTGKILIFLLATMAFPAEVAMIPSFLMLKDLGLLNTFWALVLPGMASGYMIFLLKGFFDSLPQELFESGQIDGAKESTMMMKIAFPLSRPVLGYLALLAFMGSYGAFMYAFLVTQDRKMWTLMVFIYQLQNSAPKAVMMAALTVAAIPTLLVFLAAQRVILKGIVLPGER